MKRIFAISATIVLCMSMILTFGGCGKKKREIVKLTLSTEDSEAILAAAGIMLPDAETTSAAGTTVDFYAWGDPFHNYSDDEIINTGYILGVSWNEEFDRDIKAQICSGRGIS